MKKLEFKTIIPEKAIYGGTWFYSELKENNVSEIECTKWRFPTEDEARMAIKEGLVLLEKGYEYSTATNRRGHYNEIPDWHNTINSEGITSRISIYGGGSTSTPPKLALFLVRETGCMDWQI